MIRRPERLNQRRGMVKTLDGFTHDVAPTTLVTSRDQFADRAYDLLTSSKAQAALGSATMESEAGAYGRNTAPARSRRESRSSRSTTGGTNILQWDTHAQNFPTIKNNLAPPPRHGALDLARRSQAARPARRHAGDRDGRVRPDAQDQPEGRPRPPWAGQLRLAWRRCQRIPWGPSRGKTDAKGDSPIDRPVTPADLAATLYTALRDRPEFPVLDPATADPSRLAL